MRHVLDNIRKIRELKDLSREWVAHEMGMSLSGYSKLERGEVDWTLTKLGQIAAILEVPVAELFDPALEASMLPSSQSAAANGHARPGETGAPWAVWEEDVRRLKMELAYLRERLERRD